MSKQIIIVDENDTIIGYKDRSQVNSNDIYRVSALSVHNSKGDVLLAQRKLTKKNDPGKWGPAVAGTVEKGETYDSNILKETEEEIGVKGYQLEKTQKVRVRGKHNFFCQWYKLTIDENINYFTIQDEEVEQIKWSPEKGLVAKIKDSPDEFVGSFEDYIEILKTTKTAL